MQAHISAMEELARQFADYLRGQTGIELDFPEPGDRVHLQVCFERLDHALGQIADLASVYGADHRSDIEPLTIPTAALAGEFLRLGIHASWMEPAYEGDTNLMLVTIDGVALDMEGMSRSVLLSQSPALGKLVAPLIKE